MKQVPFITYIFYTIANTINSHSFISFSIFSLELSYKIVACHKLPVLKTSACQKISNNSKNAKFGIRLHFPECTCANKYGRHRLRFLRHMFKFTRLLTAHTSTQLLQMIRAHTPVFGFTFARSGFAPHFLLVYQSVICAAVYAQYLQGKFLFQKH